MYSTAVGVLRFVVRVARFLVLVLAMALPSRRLPRDETVTGAGDFRRIVPAGATILDDLSNPAQYKVGGGRLPRERRALPYEMYKRRQPLSGTRRYETALIYALA
jgi:hypothetical protein